MTGKAPLQSEGATPGMWSAPEPAFDDHDDAERETAAFWAGVEQGRREGQSLEHKHRIYPRLRAGFAAIGILAVLWFLSNLATRHDSSPAQSSSAFNGEELTLLYLGKDTDERRVEDMRRQITRYAQALGWDDEDVVRDELQSSPGPEGE